MATQLLDIDKEYRTEIEKNKYAFISANDYVVSDCLQQQKKQFHESWDNLPLDNHLKNNSSYRLRRFRYFYLVPNKKLLLPYPLTPYYQPAIINAYAEGADRQFSVLPDDIAENEFMRQMIFNDVRQLPVSENDKSKPWLLDVHQVRIKASINQEGEPTPEGIHHDENDFVWIHLIQRKNVKGGVNTMYQNDGSPLESLTLNQCLDSIVLWDKYVMHGVSTITPDDMKHEAIRDIFLIGYSICPDLKAPTGNATLDYKQLKSNINPPVLRNPIHQQSYQRSDTRYD